MNVEVYSYSIIATVLGMLVVFLSLSALSVMMVVLKQVFSGEGKQRAVRSSGKRRTKEARAGRLGVDNAKAGKDLGSQSAEQLPAWLPAAVGAYLAAEQEPDRPSADPWNAVVNQYDPWIAGGRFSKRGV
ncbi:MAG: OadG family protein [Spirochaetaceae bacterium]|nr:MAG: OadG family protein [Spirochaetaceae bacterium]